MHADALVRASFVLTALLLLASPAQAQRIRIPRAQDAPPGPALSPQEAIAKMTVPEGFSVELVAAEPDVVNPVAMCIDEKGRFWVTESFEYPRREPGPGRDRVKTLEDSNGDGKADKVTVFAEGLNIPSGIAVGHGGVWVANAPDILFMQDTDGDGKADRQEVVVTGFGRLDTHELPNSFTWGPDGWLYGLNGVFNNSHVRYAESNPNYRSDHPGWPITCAVWRINPRTREFQVFAEGTSNPWGIAVDSLGSLFLSACVIDHLWHIVETGYYHRQAGAYPPHTWKIESIVRHKHQKAAYCGITWFDSDAYPREYRETLYMGNIHGNCINADVVERQGATYFGKPRPDFLSANDAWFMPVVQKTGPDGCLYVLDWYDRYHCYQDANADPEGIDRGHGRLYRVRYKDTPRMPGFDLAKESDERLIERLSSPNVYFRETAQRLLSERASGESKAKLQSLALDARAPVKTRLHALWSVAGMGPIEEPFCERLMAQDEAALRAWGVRLAGNRGEISPAIAERIAALRDDRSPDVQLQRAIAATKLEGVPTLATLLEVQMHAGDDPILSRIVWQNLRPLIERQPQEVAQELASRQGERLASLAPILPRAVEMLARHRKASPAALAEVAKATLESSAAPVPAKAQTLAALSAAAREGAFDESRRAALKLALAPSAPSIAERHPELGEPLASLRALWGEEDAIKRLQAIFADAKRPPQARIDALQTLASLGGDAVLESVGAALAERRGPADLKAQIIATLGGLNQPGVAKTLLAAYPSLDPSLQSKVVETLSQRASWSLELTQAAAQGKVAKEMVNLNQLRRLASFPDERLKEEVRKVWGVVREETRKDRQQVIEHTRRLLQESPADPFRGEEIFKRVCAQCHKMYGEGAEVGPDITRNGRNNYEQLLSNMLDPSLVIGPGYQARIVVTSDGRVLTGLPVEESQERLVLKIQGGKLETIARDDIEEEKISEASMMPDQLEKQLSEQELADLFAYLVLDKHPSDPSARRLSGAPAPK